MMGASVADLWREIGLPWLAGQATTAWRNEAPSVVLVPDRITAFYAKSMAVDKGLNLLGIEFWTPSDARLRLRQWIGPEVGRGASRESLELMIRQAARRAYGGSRQNATAEAIVADPAAFRQLIDRVYATGMDLSKVASPQLREVERNLTALLEAAGLMHSARVDFGLERAMEERGPVLGDCLCMGFDGEAWSRAPVLTSVLMASREATVGLTVPAEPGEEADRLWISSLEQRFGACEMVEVSERPGPDDAPPLLFHLADSLSDEADIAAAQVAQWMAQEEDARICVAVPPSSGLGLLVTERLAAMGLPLHSRFGRRRPGMLEDPAWKAWLEFLQEPGLPALLELADALDPVQLRAMADAGAKAEFGHDELLSALDEAYQNVLSERVEVLATWLDGSRRTWARHAQVLLRKLDPLPEHGTLQNLWEGFAAKAIAMGWSERLELLQPRASELLEVEQQLELSGADFAAWLGALSESHEFQRVEETGHYYSRIHVLAPGEAVNQAWSHLLMVGQTEGEWPPARQVETFLSRKESATLRARLREKVESKVTEGAQGEGHEILPPGSTWLRDVDASAEKARRSFNRLMQQYEEGGMCLAVSAHVGHEATPSLPLQPGEFFLRAYRLAVARHPEMPPTLDDSTQERIRRRSSALRDKYRPAVPVSGGGASRSDLHAMLEAQRQRRTGKNYSAYDFCLHPGANTPEPLRLSCREWEGMLRMPASAFLRHVLGVGPRSEFTGEAFYRRSRGTWVHEWLGAMLPKAGERPRDEPVRLQELPQDDERRQRVQRAAASFRQEAESALVAAGQSPPLWWEALWEESLGLTLQLAEWLGEMEGYTHGATEWTVAPHPWKRAEEDVLWLRGRFDCLLGNGEDWQQSDRLLILDYKTGSSSKFSLAEIGKEASGVQLALYALVLSTMTPSEVQVALASPTSGFSRLLSQEDLEVYREGWEELIRVQNSGCFGWRHPVRDPYRQVEELPLATLALPENVGKAKWKRAHPAWGGLA